MTLRVEKVTGTLTKIFNIYGAWRPSYGFDMTFDGFGGGGSKWRTGAEESIYDSQKRAP